MEKLIRKEDNLVKEGLIEYIKWNKQGRGQDIFMKPEVGFSCIIHRRLKGHSWMTSPITEIISDTEFKTENSHYKIED